jgi:hypothetical protein
VAGTPDFIKSTGGRIAVSDRGLGARRFDGEANGSADLRHAMVGG